MTRALDLTVRRSI